MKNFSKEHSMIVKGVAIMLLLVYHLFHESAVLREMHVNYAPFSEEAFLCFSGFGNICVAVFVMLTAYGISQIVLLKNETTIRGIYADCLKRFIKLMLGVVAAYVSVNLICFPYFNYANLYGTGKQSILLALCDATGLSAILNTPMLNPTWWYMKLAYVLIFLVPLLVYLVKKLGNMVLLLAFFAPFVVGFDADVERYFFVAVFGVCASCGKWPEKIMNLKIHPIFWWGIGLLGTPICVMFRQNALIKAQFCNYADAVAAFFIICITATTVGNVPVLNSILKFIGKHSMNIFLVHTFFYMIVWRKYVYYFEPAIWTFLILLGVSLVYSVILEGCKSVIEKIIKIFTKKLKKD
ncbi:MAG: acyltransferase [Lachnospiraceae bacterium]|nr:acyltransferase [Lachnospiraceae bacterium]